MSERLWRLLVCLFLAALMILGASYLAGGWLLVKSIASIYLFIGGMAVLVTSIAAFVETE